MDIRQQALEALYKATGKPVKLLEPIFSIEVEGDEIKTAYMKLGGKREHIFIYTEDDVTQDDIQGAVNNLVASAES